MKKSLLFWRNTNYSLKPEEYNLSQLKAWSIVYTIESIPFYN